jgi:hypothetical protein
MKIVDAQTRKSRHQMLDCRDAALALSKYGSHTRVSHHRSLRRDVNDLGQIDPMKDNPRIRRGWAQRQLDPAARVKADPCGLDEIFKRTLAKHKSKLIP